MDEIINFMEMEPDVIISREKLFNIRKFLDTFASNPINFPHIKELYLVPFYIKDGKRLELYYYQFRLDKTDGKDIISYILSVSGKSSIDDVDDKLIDVLKHGYFTSEKSLLKNITDWMNYIIKNKELISEVEKVFDKPYESKNMYFDIFAT